MIEIGENWMTCWPEGKVRTARKQHRCDYIKRGGLRCAHVIAPGEHYFDPGDSNPESAGGFGGFRYCLNHPERLEVR